MNHYAHKRLAILLGSAAFALQMAAADDLTPLDLRRVKAGGEIGRRVEVTITNNLLVLNADKDFLSPFIEKKAKSGYVGLGKLMDATVKFAANTGDERVVALKKRLVERTIAAQEADGYIGMMAPDARVSGMWDIHEMGYIIWALVTDHQYFGEKRSLDAAKKLADYILQRWRTIPKDWDATTGVATHVSVTGLERTMLALHRAMGERRYLDFCLRERALPDWNIGIIVGRRPMIEGHIYAYMARCLAQLELYREQPQAKLLKQTDRAMDFLLHHDGLAITGGAGQWEIWTDDQDVRGELGETCATAYQLRVYDSLLRLRGDARYGDLIERTVYNALFAAQSPDGRHIRYYSPLEGSRVYHPTDTYCCPCNYRRIVAELPAMVYYRWRNGLAVNLFTASEAKLELPRGVTLAVRQETDYPSAGRVVIRLDPSAPAKFPLRLRIPVWTNGAKISVNGEPLARAVVAGKFADINREWKAGDQVTLEVPMDWRLVKGRQRQAGRVAVMRGPLVFCLNPSQRPDLEKQDGADLGRITLDPSSLKVTKDNSVRSGGVACRVHAWKPGYSVSPKPEFELTLTEFPDPDGKATCFRLRDLSVAADDELFARGR